MSAEDREKLTFSELDRLRREKGRGEGGGRPRGAAGEARSKEATASYLKQVDRLFSTAKGGVEGEALTKALHDAHGTPELADACRAYRDHLGMPDEPALLSLFLDAEDPEIVVAAIQALGAGHRAGSVQVSRGIKSQLRVLAQGANDDVAYEAEELLAEL